MFGKVGFKVTGPNDAKTLPPIFPKLWRRLFSDFKGDPADLAAFVKFLQSQDERLHTLSDDRFIAFDEQENPEDLSHFPPTPPADPVPFRMSCMLIRTTSNPVR